MDPTLNKMLRDGLITKEDVQRLEQVEAAALAAQRKEAIEIEAHVGPREKYGRLPRLRDPPSSDEDDGDFVVTVGTGDSEEKLVKKLTLEAAVAKLRKVEEENKRLIGEVNRLRDLLTLDGPRIKRAEVGTLLDGVYNKIYERCNTRDEEASALEWCPYGCNTCWDTYDEIVVEELDNAKAECREN